MRILLIGTNIYSYMNMYSFNSYHSNLICESQICFLLELVVRTNAWPPMQLLKLTPALQWLSIFRQSICNPTSYSLREFWCRVSVTMATKICASAHLHGASWNDCHWCNPIFPTAARATIITQIGPHFLANITPIAVAIQIISNECTDAKAALIIRQVAASWWLCTIWSCAIVVKFWILHLTSKCKNFGITLASGFCRKSENKQSQVAKLLCVSCS